MTSPIIKALEGLEAIAFMWQHHETGRIGFTDSQQLAAGFREINPRLKIIAPLYTADQFAAAYERLVAEPCPVCRDINTDEQNIRSLMSERLQKLVDAGTPFFIVKASEPYARQVVKLIRADQGERWTDDDQAYADSVLPKCQMCNGKGMVGGFVNAENGYDRMDCPDCSTAAPSDAGVAHHAALQRIGTALGLLPGADLHTECVPAIEVLRVQAGLSKIIAEKNAQIDGYGIQTWEYRIDDAQRYQRLALLGCAPMGHPCLEKGTVLRWQTLDAFVDEDIKRYPYRGEAAPLSAYERSAKVEQPADWQREFVRFVLRETDCSREQAFSVLGRVIDLREGSSQQGFARGFNTAHAELSANAGAQAVDAEFAEDMDELCRDFYKYQEGDPRMPFSTIRPSIISVLEQWQRLRAESLKQPADSVQAERVCKCCGERIEKGSQP